MANEETETPEVTDTNTPVEPAETPETQTPSPEENTTETTDKPVETVETPKTETVPQYVYDKLYGKVKHLERELAGHNTPTQKESNQEPQEPNWEQYEQDGKTVEQFNSDYIGHQVQKGIAASKAADAEQATNETLQDRQQKAGINFATKAQTFRISNPDFDSVMASADTQGISFSPEINLAISESGDAASLAYHAVKDPQVAYKLMSLPHDKALVELGKLMGNLPAGNSQPALNLTKTNPPPNPLEQGGNPNSGVIDENSTIADFQRLFPD